MGKFWGIIDSGLLCVALEGLLTDHMSKGSLIAAIGICQQILYNLLNVNNDALIVMCVAPEGLLTDHMSKGSLIAAIGGTIDNNGLAIIIQSILRMYALQLIVQWCFMLCIISTSTIKRIARMDSEGTPTYYFGITWAVSLDHYCSSVITIRKLNRKLYIGDYRLTRQLYQ